MKRGFADPTAPYQEVSLLAEIAPLKCANFLELIDQGEDKDNLYLVTKVYAGNDLFAYL